MLLLQVRFCILLFMLQFKVDTNDPRPALIRKESKDFKKSAKNSRWLQGSLISAIGKCKDNLRKISIKHYFYFPINCEIFCNFQKITVHLLPLEISVIFLRMYFLKKFLNRVWSREVLD